MFIEFRDKQIPVTVSNPPLLKDALESELLTNWLESLDPSFDLKAIELQSVDKFSSGRVGFIKFKSTIIRNGVEIPGIVILRGASVSLLLEITDDETNDKYTILVKQPRVPIGTTSIELPAGMVDGSGNLKGVAIRELEEECGIIAKSDELIDLTYLAYGDSHPGIYFSCGLCDEYIKIFLWRTKMPHEAIQKIEGTLGGKNEREQIVLKLVKFDEAYKITNDPQLLCAFELYNCLKHNGKL